VVFEVDDDGPGIPSDQMPFVFDRFVASADTGGTGLGLAIAKRLVEAHGGTIEAIPPNGGGTHMRVRIPSGRP
jgi:two-component system, OmpR family, sensor histidine kinase BaeS